MKETKYLEYKETITNTFLKTVSAFANYDGGEIVFGIDDNGVVKGLDDIEQACLDIENKINDSITPQPEYTMNKNQLDKTVVLSVKSGMNKPYLYKSKAYKRNDTATIEVDSLELTRLILAGKNLAFEALPAKMQSLTFQCLADKLKQHVKIEVFHKDILKTLNLLDDEKGYNNAAAILADENDFPGIDVAKFGENISIIQKRATYDHMSVLEAYDRVVDIYRDYYQHEEISGLYRETVERIPEAAFREAVANALIHRTWDINAQIRISMFDDKIEILSPGGLPNGIKKEEYLSGRISVLRNQILASVFYRLGIVEIFGTGILRIGETYKDSVKKPVYEVTENAIKVILPVMETYLDLSEDERKVYEVLSKTMAKSISEIVAYVPYGKSKVTAILKELHNKEIVKIEGRGRGTKYRL